MVHATRKVFSLGKKPSNIEAQSEAISDTILTEVSDADVPEEAAPAETKLPPSDEKAALPSAMADSSAVPGEAPKESWGFDDVTIQCTPLARSQIEKAIAKQKIPFVKSSMGLLLLFLLLRTVRGGIEVFNVSAGVPFINNLPPGLGGLPFWAWKLWNVAAKFPDKVQNLLKYLPIVPLDQNLSYASFPPSILHIIDQFEHLETRKGEVKYMVPPDRARLVNACKGGHNPEAVDKLLKAQYGEGLILKDVQIGTSYEGKLIDRIILASDTTKAKCPWCGQETTQRAKGGPYNHPRQFWDTPIRFGFATQVLIERPRKYVCQNPECAKKQFVETFSCVAPYKQFSIRLCGTVLAMAALTSYHGEQDLWKLCGVEISDDTIRRLVLGLVFEDNPNVKWIGIDDVAKRKGVSYYTIIYALDDHRLLAIVDGRDGSELIKWLEKHPKVNLICRDRGTAYSNAINNWATAHGAQVTEVADRFHLIQNMIGQLKDHFLSSLPLRIGIIVENDTVRMVDGDDIPHKKAYAKTPKPSQGQLDSMRYDNTPPLNEEGNPIEFDVVLTGKNKGSEAGIPEGVGDPVSSDTPAGTAGSNTETDQRPIDDAEQEKRVKLYILISTIRSEFDPSKAKKPQYKELAEKHGLDKKKVAGQYCRMKPDEVEAILNGVSPERKEKARAALPPQAVCTDPDNQQVSDTETSAKDGDQPDKYVIICNIRAEFDSSKPKRPQYAALAEKYGVDATSVGRYCRMTDEEVEAVRQNPAPQEDQTEKQPRKPKAKKIDEYKYIIYKMLDSGHNISDIFWYVKSKGCTLTDGGLLKHIIAIHGIVFPNQLLPLISQYIDLKYEEGVYVIRRCELLKYLVTVNPKTSKSELIAKYEERILDKYASVRNVKTMFKEFHSAIMGDDEEAIDHFISKYGNGELKGFCDTLNHDIEAIKNAVRYTYSSGFVEGNNSKFKMLKSISRGRLHLNSLYQKCMLGFWYTLEGFALKDVAPWLR